MYLIHRKKISMNSLQEPNEIIANENNDLPQQHTETAALAYINAGLSVLPLGQNKTPDHGSWKQYQDKIAEPSTIESWFSNGSSSQIGIVCGAVSGNLEVIDIDEKYNLESASLFDRYKEIVDRHTPGLWDKLVIEQSQSKGYHLI